MITWQSFGADGLRHLRGLSDTARVDGADPEHIGLAFLQVLHLRVTMTTSSHEGRRVRTEAARLIKRHSRGSHLQVAVVHSLLVQSHKVFAALLGHVHKVSGDGARSGVDGRLPQDDQGVTSDLTEAQVVGWA